MSHGRTIGLATTDEVVAVEIGDAVVAAAAEVGVSVVPVATRADARGVDFVLGIGLPVNYALLGDRAIGVPRVAWLGEPVPVANEATRERLMRAIPLGRALDATIAVATARGRRPTPRPLRHWRENAAWRWVHRYDVRTYRRLAARGVRLVATSSGAARFLASIGLPASCVPFGYHPAHAGPLTDADAGDRDVDVIVLASGIRGVTRRARIVPDLVSRLGNDVRTSLIEEGVHGADRNRHLRRAKVMLNVHRTPGNFTGLRSILAAAAGVALVSEPVPDPEPFVPGEHYVEAPLDELPAAAAALLADPDRRAAMVRRTQGLLRTDLTMANSVCRLVELGS